MPRPGRSGQGRSKGEGNELLCILRWSPDALTHAGAQRIATRVSGDPTSANNGVFWALTDHLGSTAVTLNSSAQKVADIRYDPWGKARLGATGYTPTDRRSCDG